MSNVLPMHQNLDPDPDIRVIFLETLKSVRSDISPEDAEQVWKKLQSKLGGRRFYFPKGAKHPTAEQRAALFKDGLSSMETDEIIKKHNVSRRTVYRVMKEGGGRFS